MTDLVRYLRRHKSTLNLAKISREAGYSGGYLKHVVSGRISMSPEAEKRIAAVLETLVTDFHKKEA